MHRNASARSGSISWLAATGGLLAALGLTDCLLATRETECGSDRACPSNFSCNLQTSICEPSPSAENDGGAGRDGGADMTGCRGEADCASGLACVDGQCQACRGHSDCESQVCEPGSNLHQQRGCLPADSVVYTRAGGDCATADGTLARPFCTIRGALGLVNGSKVSVRILPGVGGQNAYSEQLNFDGSTTVLAANLYGSTVVGQAASLSGASSVVLISGSARLLLDGLILEGGTTPLLCSVGTSSIATDIRLRRVTIRGATGVGLSSSNCTVSVDRSRFESNAGGALFFRNNTTYQVTNSFIINNSVDMFSYAAVFISGGSGKFAFNTLVGNLRSGSKPGAIDCASTAATISNSIIYGPIAGAATQIALGCQLDNSLIAANDPFSGGTSVLRGTPKFVDVANRDIHLNSDDSDCVDKISTNAGLGVAEDFDGTPRLKGGGYDVGAHELR